MGTGKGDMHTGFPSMMALSFFSNSWRRNCCHTLFLENASGGKEHPYIVVKKKEHPYKPRLSEDICVWCGGEALCPF